MSGKHYLCHPYTQFSFAYAPSFYQHWLKKCDFGTCCFFLSTVFIMLTLYCCCDYFFPCSFLKSKCASWYFAHGKFLWGVQTSMFLWDLNNRLMRLVETCFFSTSIKVPPLSCASRVSKQVRQRNLWCPSEYTAFNMSNRRIVVFLQLSMITFRSGKKFRSHEWIEE